MRILPITSPSPQRKHSTNFGKSGKIVCNDTGSILYRTSTWFFREDLNWWALPGYLSKKYKNVDRVNIINHVCSTGEEPLSLAMKLIDSLGEFNSAKFFPIIARDLDEENIRNARQGNFYADINEKAMLNNIMLDRPENYFKTQLLTPKYNEKKYQVSFMPKILNKINFSQGDILEDSKTLPTKNTVLLCRNFWPYLECEQRETLLKNISERFEDGSCLLILGHYDFGATPDDTDKKQLERLLKKYRFTETWLEYVYQKQQ